MRARFAAALLAAVMLAASEPAFACTFCFKAEESSLIDASKLGVFVLLGITLAVQGAFAAFFFHLRKRAKQYAELELEAEWSELQKSSGTR